MTNKPTIDKIEVIARELERLGYGYHESHAESVLRALLAELPGVRTSGMWERVVAVLKPAEGDGDGV